MANEQIVAIGLHYFSNENITKSKLRLAPTQRGWDGVTNAFEDGNNSFAIESVPGRSVVFKNIISHRVAPFELDDPDKPGHRKILGFFLVDPGARILSSARVPCQQWAWYLDVWKTFGSEGRLVPLTASRNGRAGGVIFTTGKQVSGH